MHRRILRYWPVLLLLSACDTAQVTGRYVDFDTGEPVKGARIEITSRGWGFSNGQLVWDKADTRSTVTGEDGAFSINHTGSLNATADAYQDLREVPAVARAALILQGKAKRDVVRPIPGGNLRIGKTEDGRPFGWIFAENRSTLNLDEADLFPVTLQRTPQVFATVRGISSQFYFLPATIQSINVRSYGMLLRYIDNPPKKPFSKEVRLTEAGTLFVRTRDNRYAKVAFDPQSMMSGQGGAIEGTQTPAGFHLILPFAYNPFPGEDLYFDPAGGGHVLPELAGAAAQLPTGSSPALVPRTYRFEILGNSGQTLQSTKVTLQPGGAGVNVSTTGPYRLENITLTYRPDGIAAVQLSIHGSSFVHHLGEIVPNRRFAVSREFHDYDSGQARPLSLVMREEE